MSIPPQRERLTARGPSAISVQCICMRRNAMYGSPIGAGTASERTGNDAVVARTRAEDSFQGPVQVRVADRDLIRVDVDLRCQALIAAAVEDDVITVGVQREKMVEALGVAARLRREARRVNRNDRAWKPTALVIENASLDRAGRGTGARREGRACDCEHQRSREAQHVLHRA